MRRLITGRAPTTLIKNANRSSIFELLNVPDGGASRRGSTYWKSVTSCPREHALTYVAKLRPVRTADALTLGWAWHHVLETYYRGMLDGTDGIVAADNVIDQLEGANDFRDIGRKLRTMFTAYLDTYERSDKWRVIAVEEGLEYVGAFEYSARLDLLVEDLVHGGMWVVEHKSANMISSGLLEGYQLDLQILGQVWLMEHCVDLSKYPTFRGVRINIVTTGAAQPKCARVEVMPSAQHLLAFERSVQALNHTQKHLELLSWPQYLGHCAGYARGYGRCQFFDLCHDYPEFTVADWADPKTDVPPTYVRKPQLEV